MKKFIAIVVSLLLFTSLANAQDWALKEQSAYYKIQAPVYGFYGANDNRVNATIDDTKKMMIKAGITYEAVNYDGVGHAFMHAGMEPDATDVEKKAYCDAFDRLIDLIRKL